MSILIFAIVVLIIAALVFYAVQQIPLTPPFGNLLLALVLIIAALLIAQRAGLL